MSTDALARAGTSVGVDIGGTFTDVVARDAGGRMRFVKIPTTRKDESEAVLRSVALMAERWGVSPAEVARFAHGTTVATNAVLERKGARIGLLATEGFRDVLEIRRLRMPVLYDIRSVSYTHLTLPTNREV